jgi:hypothetical protein
MRLFPLIGRKIENQQAINASLLRFVLETIEAKSQNRIQIGVEHDATSARNRHTSHGCVRFECALRRYLIQDSMGEWIGKWNAQLQNIGTSFF